MADFPITAYDRPGIAAANLLQGDIGATVRALFAPETLAPSKTDPLYKSMMKGLWKTAADNPLLRGIMSVATDPFVIIGLLMSSKYPVVAASKMFEYGAKYAGYAYKPGLFTRLFGRASRLFAGTNVPRLMNLQAESYSKFLVEWGDASLGKKIAEVQTRLGRAVSPKEWLAIGGKLAGLDAPNAVAGVARPLLANKIQLSPAADSLYTYIRQTWLPDMWKKVVFPLRQSDAGRAALRKALAQGGISLGATEKEFERIVAKAIAGGPVKDYFPHTLIRTPEMSLEYANAALEAVRGRPAEMRRITQASALSKMSGHGMPRFGILVPRLEELQQIGKVDPAAWRQVQEKVRQRAAVLSGKARDEMADLFSEYSRISGPAGDPGLAGHAVVEMSNWLRKHGVPTGHLRRELGAAYAMWADNNPAGFQQEIQRIVYQAGMQREYSVAALPVLNNYMQSLSRPYVWSATKIGEGYAGLPPGLTIGKAFIRENQRLLPAARRMMDTDYMPLLQGQLTESQATGMMAWTNMKMKVLETLDGPLGKMVGPTWTKKLQGMLTAERGGLSYLNAQGKIAGYFYFSALGFNPSSAIQNLLQTVITTMPMVGTKAYWSGMQKTVKQLTGPEGYFALRAKGVVPEQAMLRAFPQFVKAGMAPAPLSSAILRGTLEEFWTTAHSATGGALMGTSGHYLPRLDQVKRAAMSMFSGSEMWNRLLSFNAGLAHAAAPKSGITGAKQSLEYAANVVRATQFPAGPAEMPRILMKLPAPWRQFMYFPIRYAGFLAESTAYGAGAPGARAGRQWGTIGRTMAASAAAYRGGKELLGVDMSRSLMFGALPLPQYEGSPFYPLPFVPPVASLLGAGVQSAFTGDTAAIRRAAGLLVPGGVPLRRAYRTLHPKYAKYGERTADGKIPVFGENEALVGNYTPTQLFMRTIGLQPREMATEQGLMKYLLKQRDEIREVRRSYVEAIVQGNAGKAQRIQEAFGKRFPQLGKITVKKSDIQAAQDRHMMTRLQRLIKTLPKEYRAMFQEVVDTAMGGYAGEMFQGEEPAAMYQQPQPSMPSPFSAGAATPFGGGAWGVGDNAFPAVSSGATPLFDPASLGL